MSDVKFSAERFKDENGIKIRFAIRGRIFDADFYEIVKSAGFALTEGVADTYFAWAKNPEEASAIQNAIKPLITAGKISV